MRVDLDLGDLGFDEGAALLIRRALRASPPGKQVLVTGCAPDLDLHIESWCRSEGHEVKFRRSNQQTHAVVTCGSAPATRWLDAQRAGLPNPAVTGAVSDHPSRRWGLAARGALVESNVPEFDFNLVDRAKVWVPDAGHIYTLATAAQWDPATAIPWQAQFESDTEIEDAVVQIMTYLIENETAALMVPSRFIAQLHPHFQEVMQVLAVQAADEARHIEVFSRRARLKRDLLGCSTSGGQESLKSLIDEPDFAVSSFLLSVLGEGTFLSLLWFLDEYAPDPVTKMVSRLAAQDEARHVAFGIAHIREHLANHPGKREQLTNAIRRRHDRLHNTSGLNAEVFDALVHVAAGSWSVPDLRCGYGRVKRLIAEMHDLRRKRLVQLGYSDEEASELSGLHTRNFM